MQEECALCGVKVECTAEHLLVHCEGVRSGPGVWEQLPRREWHNSLMHPASKEEVSAAIRAAGTLKAQLLKEVALKAEGSGGAGKASSRGEE